MKKYLILLLLLLMPFVAEAGTDVHGGAVTVASDLTVANNLSVANTASVNTLAVAGDAAVTGDTTVTGELWSDGSLLTGTNICGWIDMSGSGTHTVNASYNVSVITDLGEGAYKISWDTDFADSYYAVAASSGQRETQLVSDDKKAGYVRFNTRDSSGTSADAASLCVIAIGDQ